jgi:hypothetical protein
MEDEDGKKKRTRLTPDEFMKHRDYMQLFKPKGAGGRKRKIDSIALDESEEADEEESDKGSVGSVATDGDGDSSKREFKFEENWSVDIETATREVIVVSYTFLLSRTSLSHIFLII